MLPWIVLFVALGLLLSVGVERLLARLGIRPEDPESARGGVRVVAERLETWAAQRKRRDE